MVVSFQTVTVHISQIFEKYSKIHKIVSNLPE